MKPFFLFLTIFSLSLFAIPKQSFKLDPVLKKSYLALLRQASDFHKAINASDKKAFQKEKQETQKIISTIYRQTSSFPDFHQRIHSRKLLKSIEEQMEVIVFSNSLNQNIEKKNIKKLFNSFFELAQVYDLKKDMKNQIFYCSRDKSLWFQENGKAKNPINPDYKNCGRRIL